MGSNEWKIYSCHPFAPDQIKIYRTKYQTLIVLHLSLTFKNRTFKFDGTDVFIKFIA